MPDRLAELRRQRALLTEHLAWLDGEIATAADRSGEPPAPAAAPAPGPVPTPPAPIPGAGPPASPEVEAIIDRYRSSPGAVQRDLRRGCFLYLAAAVVLTALGVTALYFMISSR